MPRTSALVRKDVSARTAAAAGSSVGAGLSIVIGSPEQLAGGFGGGADVAGVIEPLDRRQALGEEAHRPGTAVLGEDADARPLGPGRGSGLILVDGAHRLGCSVEVGVRPELVRVVRGC